MRDDDFRIREERERNPDFEKLINRMCRAKWIDAIVERRERALQFHFTELGKERFRTLFEIINELGNEQDLMNADERSEILAIVEAWIQDVEEQKD